MLHKATRFASNNWLIPAEDLELSIEPVGGGLESSVARVTFQSPVAEGETTSFMVKELCGLHRRETEIYKELWKSPTSPPTVQLLGFERTADVDYLFLEEAIQHVDWPWKQTAVSAAVCRALAQLHDTHRLRSKVLIGWDYETELARSAEETLAFALVASDNSGVRYWRRLGDLRRVVAALPNLRSALLKTHTFIHGDVHPGNVIVQATDKGESITFIDWARARVGSPLEDLASWLQSLGCWEPEARRRHDTLLRAYFDARACKQKITTELRELYWYASASNGLAGAIRYHLAVLADPASPADLKSDSERALPSWERVIRRVSAILATNQIC